MKREDIYKDIYIYKFKGSNNFEVEVTNKGLYLYKYDTKYELIEVNIMNFDIYLKKKIDERDETIKDSINRKIKFLKKQLKEMRKMKMNKKEIMKSKELKMLMFLLLVDALELNPYDFNIFRDIIIGRNKKLYKKLTTDLIYEVKRIFNMTKNSKDEEIEKLLSLLDEKQISELENNNKYLEYVKKNFQYTSDDNQDEKNEDLKYVKKNFQYVSDDNQDEDLEENDETEEKENITGSIYKYNLRAYDLLLKIANKLSSYIFTSVRCQSYMYGKKLNKMFKVIDNEKMKTVKKYLKYKIFKDHIDYICNEKNENIQSYLMGKLEDSAYNIDDLNKNLIDNDMEEMDMI